MIPPKSEDIRDRLTFLQFAGIYLAMVLGGVGFALGVHVLTGIEIERATLATCGVLLVLPLGGNLGGGAPRYERQAGLPHCQTGFSPGFSLDWRF